jgi:Cys-tRNA(Pro)/Cys-tRNA(Cys) deacylase
VAKRDKVQKTNAMRALDTAGIAYEALEIEGEEDISRGLGVRLAEQAGEDLDAAFKTLVCVAPTGEHVVCCIPVAQEVDLKKAASAAGAKSLALMPIRDLEQVTGYVRGACSPVGMKRLLPTLIDETAQLFEQIYVSGGRRGLSLRLSPDELCAFCHATFADICR